MTATLGAYLLGGIGLFILGMVLMTEGLRNIAGNSLRSALSRFTGGRFSSICTGIGITALMQSSHATLIATIGFVSAGLLSFEQSIGIVIGSHIGTTSTGWLVSVIGMKLKISMISFPAIGFGAMMRLLGKERTSNIGLILAGFGLIFLGIDTLQTGMKDLAGTIDLSAYSGSGAGSRFILVALGIGMTILLQSSSAALTITLTALYAGSLTIEQSAALVVGQNVGTTLTAAIAAIGGSTSAKRTAAAHIIFNTTTAITVFFFLPWFVMLLIHALSGLGVSDPTILLPAFHTAFNIFGMFIALPLIGPFSKLIIHMIPERGPVLTRHIDYTVATIPSVAIEAARRTARDIVETVVDEISDRINGKDNAKDHILESIDEALTQSRQFLAHIRTDKGATQLEQKKHISVLHIIDHAEQLVDDCRDTENIQTILSNEPLKLLAEELSSKMRNVLITLTTIGPKVSLDIAEETAHMMKDIRKGERSAILQRTARGEIDTEEAYRQIEAIRWLDRISYRAWRAAYHIGEFD